MQEVAAGWSEYGGSHFREMVGLQRLHGNVNTVKFPLATGLICLQIVMAQSHVGLRDARSAQSKWVRSVRRCATICCNGVAKSFLWGGGNGPILPGSFPWSPQADQIGWGGGGSGRIFFRLLQGRDQSNSLDSVRFFYISDSKNVTTSIHCRKTKFNKSWWGGMAPVAPLATPLLCCKDFG